MIAPYLADMGMSVNVRKCAHTTTASMYSIMVRLDPENAVAPWICLAVHGEVPYWGLRLDPNGLLSKKETHVLRCQALLGWCKSTPRPVLVPHEVMAAVVGGMVCYAAPYLSDATTGVVRLNAAIKAEALHFESLPRDLSNVAVQSGKGLPLGDVRAVCCDSVVASVGQLTRHHSAVVKGELQAMVDDLHGHYGVCGQFMVPWAAFASHAGDTSIDRLLRAMGTLGIGLLMPCSVYACAHAHWLQVQWARRQWATRSYSFKGRDIYVLSRPRTKMAVRSMTDPTSNLFHAGLPCFVPGQWAARLSRRPSASSSYGSRPYHGGSGMVDSSMGLKASLPVHRLLHPVRHKKATKRTKISATGDAYVVGGYKNQYWKPDCLGTSMPFTPPASLMVVLGMSLTDIGNKRTRCRCLSSRRMQGVAYTPRSPWVVHGEDAFHGECATVWGRAEWAIVLLLPTPPARDADETRIPRHDGQCAARPLCHSHVAAGRWSGGTGDGGGSPATRFDGGVEHESRYRAQGLWVHICRCETYGRPHDVHGPREALFSKLTAAN